MTRALLATVGASALLLPLDVSIAQSGGVRRFAADSFWARRWSRGGEREPDLLVEPRQVAVTRTTAHVLDLGSREVITLDLMTGATRSVLTARGEGPGEFRRPVHIVPVPASVAAATGSESLRRVRFGVLDAATSRLTLYDSAARHVRTAAAPNPVVVNGACLLPDGSALYKSSGTTEVLTRVDSSGRRTRVAGGMESPAARARANAPDTDDALRGSGVLVGPTSRGKCVVAARYGGEWYLVPPRGAITRHPYVSAPPPPRIERQERTVSKGAGVRTLERTHLTQGQSSATGAMLRGDTLIVRGYATGKLMHRVLDYYLLPGGQYVYSRRLPFVFAAVSVGDDGTFVGLDVTEDGGVAHAFHPSFSREASRSRDSVARRPRRGPARPGGHR